MIYNYSYQVVVVVHLEKFGWLKNKKNGYICYMKIIIFLCYKNDIACLISHRQYDYLLHPQIPPHVTLPSNPSQVGLNVELKTTPSGEISFNSALTLLTKELELIMFITLLASFSVVALMVHSTTVSAGVLLSDNVISEVSTPKRTARAALIELKSDSVPPDEKVKSTVVDIAPSRIRIDSLIIHDWQWIFLK